MPRCRPVPWILLTLAALAAPEVPAQEPLIPPAALSPRNAISPSKEPSPHDGLSPRNASYTIDVTLDPEAKTLEGRQVVTWRNIQSEPTGELKFHLYWNGWRNSRSTWMLESRLRQRRDRLKDPVEGDWSYQQVDAVRLLPDPGSVSLPAPEEEGGTDLTATLRYESPDDGNPDDRTVMVVDLPEPVAPGETVRVELEWRAKIPRTFARTGFRGDYFFIAHWFPKLGVFEPEGWNAHQYHAATEYFSDYGVYDVTIHLPERFVLGATGRQQGATDNPDGTVSYRHVQEDVHAFTWTASPDFVEYEKRFERPGLPGVDMRLLMQPEHLDQAERHFRATEAALEHYGTWYGPYPYGHVTVVDPAWKSGSGGMEYPTLFTAGTRLFNPFGAGRPEGVTVHEAGHQFWYGIVGNNEFEHAWIDEGLNTFSTARVMDVEYGAQKFVERYLDPPDTDFGGFLPWMFDDLTGSRAVQGNRVDRAVKSTVRTADPQSTHTFRYFPTEASNISYGKTAQWLSTLERHLGWETLQAILSTFFERYKFGHPRPEDFFAVASEVAGQDLSWYFDQVHRRSVVFDYAVDSVKSFKAAPQGFVEGEGGLTYSAAGRGDTGDGGSHGGAQGKTQYRTEVVVRRHGGGVFPVEVLLFFDDGSQLRVPWDGRERWKLFTEERPAKLEYAAVDPERVLLLDLDYTNNSKLRESESLAAGKWASKWMVWLQDLLMTFTFFV